MLVAAFVLPCGLGASAPSLLPWLGRRKAMTVTILILVYFVILALRGPRHERRDLRR